MKRKEPIKVFMHHAENTAVGFYRIIQPARAISSQKLARVITIDFKPGEPLTAIDIPSFEENIVKWADVLLFSRMDNPSSLSVVKATKGEYHVPVLMELDDLPGELNEDSWAFEQWRQDRPISAQSPAYWALEQIRMSDAIITTNDYLKRWLEKITVEQKKNVYVIPNTIDLTNFTQKPVKDSKNLTIGWAGGSNHKNDLELIKGPILKILKENKGVRFSTFGYKPEWTKGIKRCVHTNWVGFESYYKALNKLKWDIGVAPLVDNSFNRCKSNLRWLEQSALGIPSVVSQVGPYQTVRENVTGYYANSEREWFTALQNLINRPNVRQRTGRNACNNVKRSYSPRKWAKEYARIFDNYAAKYARSAKYIF